MQHAISGRPVLQELQSNSEPTVHRTTTQLHGSLFALHPSTLPRMRLPSGDEDGSGRPLRHYPQYFDENYPTEKNEVEFFNRSGMVGWVVHSSAIAHAWLGTWRDTQSIQNRAEEYKSKTRILLQEFTHAMNSEVAGEN
jgi:hypothetical protein